MALEIPKSEIFGTQLSGASPAERSIKIFEGLRSKCKKPIEWILESP